MARRALRRFHSRRMKAKAKLVYPDWPKAYKVADYIKCCSCYCCGNARRHRKGRGRMTRQEQLALLRYHEGLNE